MANGNTPIEEAIQRGLTAGDWSGVYRLGWLRQPQEAQAICEALDIVASWDLSRLGEAVGALCSCLHRIASEASATIVADRALPRLAELFDRLRGSNEPDPAVQMEILAALAGYGWAPGVKLVLDMARQGFQSDSWEWWHVMNSFSPGWITSLGHLTGVFEALSDPLPEGLIAVALLAAANSLLNGGCLDRHPFDSPEGAARLETYLTTAEPPESQVAPDAAAAPHAAAALPFLSPERCDRLMPIARNHADEFVRLEAAAAGVQLGEPEAADELAAFCVDPRTSHRAVQYLEELGHDDAVPAAATEPSFEAAADLCAWLSQPTERGCPPDEIELLDCRDLYWPPTEDHRPVSALRYTYHRPDGSNEICVGLAGGLTACSFHRPEMVDWPLDDVYACHCSWEMAFRDDPEATGYSLEHGRQLLAEAD